MVEAGLRLDLEQAKQFATEQEAKREQNKGKSTQASAPWNALRTPRLPERRTR